MYGKAKLPAAAAFAALLLLLLGGCAGLPRLSLNPQDLYALPKLPARYTELNTLLSGILAEGAEYAAPTSGERIQPVQLVDLDGDSRQDAVAFFRNSTEEKPLKICIFMADHDGYQLLDRLEGAGSSIYSVNYTDLDGDGKQEIAVGWKATAELQVLEVYTLASDGARPLVRTDYVKYSITDLDGDGKQGLVVLRAGEEGDSLAEYYSWTEDGGLASRSPARVSSTMAELSQQGRLTRGTLRDDLGALFVTGVTDQLMAVTDILTLRNGELSNIVLSEATGVSSQIAPFSSLYPTDINGDTVTEVPRPVPLLPPGEAESPYSLVEWCSYDHRGNPSVVQSTYHNLDDGWYLQLPDTWKDRIFVSRAVTAGEAAVTFHIRGGYVRGREESSRPFLRISALTGSGREIRAVRGNRFVLGRQPGETIYTAELLDTGAGWPYSLNEDEIRAAFSLILREWLPSDN